MRILFTSRVLSVLLCCALGVSGASAQVDTDRTVRGRVIDGVSKAAVGGATLRTDAARTTTEADGRFALDLPPGTWILTVSASGYLDQTVTLDIEETTLPAPLEVSLFRMGQFEEIVEVRAERPRQIEPTAEAIEPESVLRVAGSLDNVFRAVQTMPGVAATDDFGSRLTVRGGEPDQNLTIMDGVEIYNPYRLFGLTSAFNPETVDHFELAAGGFSAKYGDRLSSILVVENRGGNSDRRLSGSTSASFTDANVILEGGLPADTRGSWLFTARRTYYDLIASPLVGSDLPAFADLQGKVDVDIGSSGRLSFFGLRSRENTDFDFDDEDRPRDFGTIVNEAGNDLVSVSYDAAVGSRGGFRTVLSWYENDDFLDVVGQAENESKRSNSPDDDAFGISEIEFDRQLSVEDIALRQEFSLLAGEDHFLETGFELHRLETALRFTALGDRNTNEANGSSVRGGVGIPDFLESSLAANRVGLWIQDQYIPHPRWTLEPGLRFDWSEANDGRTWSPRFTAIYRIDASDRLRGSVGRYTQSPGYEKLVQSDFFIDFTDSRALELLHQSSNHFIAGYERDLVPGITVRVEGFYKTFDDLLVGRLETEEERLERIAQYDFPAELQDSTPTAPIITSNPSNDASGNAYGFDVFLSKEATSRESRLAGWIAYTWSRGNREAYGRRYPFDYDRRHGLNVVGSYRLTPKWSFALTGRIASGFPYTPPIGLRVAATEDPNDPLRLIPETDANGLLVYEPDLGDVTNLNTGRLPFYARFDVRASYRPGGDTGNFELYIEVINALNRDNPLNLEPRLEYDPTSDVPSITEEPSEGFPLLPSFGIRWRF